MHQTVTSCGSIQEVGRAGIEPATPGFSVVGSSSEESALRACDNDTYETTPQVSQIGPHYIDRIDPDLSRLMDAWPNLASEAKEAILDLLNSHVSPP